MRFSQIASVATLASSASAFTKSSRTFAVNHFYGNGPLMMGRADPIVTPGEPAMHVHAVQGGNAFKLNMTDLQALDDSTCTSSRIKNDKSNYWTPSLYFEDVNNGTLEAVPMFYMNVYYFFEPTDDIIKPFPPGLRMVIGNPNLRTPPAGGADNVIDLANGTPQPVQFTCPRTSGNSANPLYPANSDGLHGVGIGDTNNLGAGAGFPDQNCDGYASPLRADIHFPSCYNPAAGLDNYKENMQFPTNNNCPEGWDHFPHLFYEVYWNTLLFADRWTQNQGTSPWVLSNGDKTGYSLHGDFLAGWDEATLAQIIENCNAGDSGMDQCPGLIGGVNDPSTSCNIPNLWPENITGPFQTLPGNNPVTGWGANGVSSNVSPAASVASSVPKATSTATSTKAAADVDSESDAPTATPKTTAVAAAGGSTTLLTSVVAETTVLYTTVTASGTQATSTSAAAGWSLKGCYSDPTNNRVMTGITFADIGIHQVTNTKCVAYCAGKGYSMAGTEYGGQCFCDNSVHGSPVLDASRCNMPCEGDSTQICGGSNSLSVYSTGSSSKMVKRFDRRHRHLERHVGSNN